MKRKTLKNILNKKSNKKYNKTRRDMEESGFARRMQMEMVFTIINPEPREKTSEEIKKEEEEKKRAEEWDAALKQIRLEWEQSERKRIEALEPMFP